MGLMPVSPRSAELLSGLLIATAPVGITFGAINVARPFGPLLLAYGAVALALGCWLFDANRKRASADAEVR